MHLLFEYFFIRSPFSWSICSHFSWFSFHFSLIYLHNAYLFNLHNYNYIFNSLITVILILLYKKNGFGTFIFMILFILTLSLAVHPLSVPYSTITDEEFEDEIDVDEEDIIVIPKNKSEDEPLECV